MSAGDAGGGGTIRTDVVVAAWTEARFELICRGLSAVDHGTIAPANVWLVVDHNDDLLARCQRELAVDRPWLRIVPNAGARGLSGARTTAVKASDADVIAFLDDDAVPDPSWLAELVGPFTDPDVLAVGGRADPVWPTERPGWWPSEFDWVVGCSYTGMPTETSEVRNVIGCSMAWRREVLLAIGGFREGVGRVGSTPLGAEETEACIRARSSYPGGRVMLVPASRVSHHVSRDRATWRYFRSRCRGEGLSKAMIASHVGRDAATSSEREHISVIRRGVLRDVRRFLRGERYAGSRAMALVMGLVLTGAGYAEGLVRQFL